MQNRLRLRSHRLATLLLLAASAARAAEPAALPGYCGVAHGADAASSRVLEQGMADRQSGRAYSTRTVQPIGSVSKTIIGLAIAQLVESGALDLDAPVDAVLGWPVRNPRHPLQPITLRQLATHSSGIRDREADYRRAYVASTAAAPSLEDYLRDYFQPQQAGLLRKRFTTAAPGTRYLYSNIGSALAALVVERRSGQSFADYVRDHVLQPLQMTDSGYPGFAAPVDTDQAATLYAADGPVAPYRLVTYPDGGLRSSCRDLDRYAQAVLSAMRDQPSALPATVVQRMLQPQWSKPPAGAPAGVTNIGLFWEYRASGAIGHSGGDPGLSALLAIEPAKALSRVQLTNIGIDEAPAAAAAFSARWKALGADPAAASGTAVPRNLQ